MNLYVKNKIKIHFLLSYIIMKVKYLIKNKLKKLYKKAQW